MTGICSDTEGVYPAGRPSCEIAIVVCGGGYHVELRETPRRLSIGMLKAHNLSYQIASMVSLASHELASADDPL